MNRKTSRRTRKTISMKPALETKELAEVFLDFLNHHGLWYQFKDWAENAGYSLEELSMEDEE